MEQPREMNLFDLCAAFGRLIGRSVKGVFGTIGSWIRLSLRKWWIVLPMVAVALVLSYYYSREENRIYEVNAVAILNGASKTVVAQEYTALSKACATFQHQNLGLMLGVPSEWAADNFRFVTYDVIDFMDDQTPDMVDYTSKMSHTDTLAVHIPDMLALQFRTRKPNDVPVLQEAIMSYLNTRGSILAPYAQYRTNLEREAKFHHDQLEKLDSLTSAFYFADHHTQIKSSPWNLMMGTREVKLFLEDIQDEMKLLQQSDARLAYANAPVVLLTPFVVTPHAVNGPIKCAAIAVLMSWLLALAIASLVEQREKILPWIRKK